MENKKMKKLKFVSLHHLDVAFTLSQLRGKNMKVTEVPYYKLANNESLNVFNEQGYVRIKTIKWVKITIPKSVSNQFNYNDYFYEDKKIRCCKPEDKFSSKLDVTRLVGVMMPIEIFKCMLLGRNTHKEGTPLSSMIAYACSADSIKLLDKNKKFVAYALQNME